MEEQAFTAKTGKKIIKNILSIFVVLLIFRFCKQLKKNRYHNTYVSIVTYVSIAGAMSLTPIRT